MYHPYQSDIDFIISHRYENDGDFWATPDKRIGKGGVFSTLASAMMLAELGEHENAILKEASNLIFSTWRKDGRFQIAPKGAIYPCHTAGVARVLCRLGHEKDDRLKVTYNHLIDTQHHDGGWRCNTYKYGRGPETEFSNPGTTLEVLDVFRFTTFLNHDKRLDKAVEFLLNHWETRRPLGPCHYGIGTLFMKVEFPFFRYNIFFYVYVLSFYSHAKKDARFQEALDVLRSKLVDGKIMVENPNKKIENLIFLKKGGPSDLATRRYHEILENLS